MSSDVPNPPSPAAPEPPPPAVLPVRYPPPPYRRSGPRLSIIFIILLLLALVLSVLFNFALLGIRGLGSSDSTVQERFHSGKATATNKIAIVRVDGVLMEGMITFAQKQIDRAVKDSNVKAVVLRIESPGGSITASDDLYKRLLDLRNGTTVNQKGGPKPVVVSMGSIAASGGYYIAVAGGKADGDSESAEPVKYLYAEPTTLTGSIGVYASFPNIAELAKKYGFTMNTIKAGNVKDSGSMFHEMTDEERLLWQTMVDHAYLRFLEVVTQGRPKLKGKLQEDIVIDETLDVRRGDKMKTELKLTRYRADGGVFTARDAEKYGLVDAIGYLDQAIQQARALGNLGEDYQVVVYERPQSLLGTLMGSQESKTPAALDANRVAAAAVPRLWYLAPQSELAGFLTAIGRE